MKYRLIKSDLIALAVIAAFVTFFCLPASRNIYENLYAKFPVIICFIKFALLAPGGELLANRFRLGTYLPKGFGLLPKMLIWGFLGMAIYAAMTIFSTGTPQLIPQNNLGHGLQQLLKAFSISFFMNLIFAPPMMLTHHLTDKHIQQRGGSFSLKDFNPRELLKEANWDILWGVHYSRLLPLFWLPAHTITFLLPKSYRTLSAALLSIVLGLSMALFQGAKNERQAA